MAHRLSAKRLLRSHTLSRQTVVGNKNAAVSSYRQGDKTLQGLLAEPLTVLVHMHSLVNRHHLANRDFCRMLADSWDPGTGRHFCVWVHPLILHCAVCFLQKHNR